MVFGLLDLGSVFFRIYYTQHSEEDNDVGVDTDLHRKNISFPERQQKQTQLFSIHI